MPKTRIPRAARRDAVTFPKPEEAPVTRAIRGSVGIGFGHIEPLL